MDDDDDYKLALGKLRAAAEVLAEQEAMREVIGTYAGRYMLWEQLSACKIYSDGFNGGDHAAMAREAGMRFVGLSLLEKVLTVNPEAYILMRTEAMARRRDLEHRFKPQEQK